LEEVQFSRHDRSAAGKLHRLKTRCEKDSDQSACRAMVEKVRFPQINRWLNARFVPREKKNEHRQRIDRHDNPVHREHELKDEGMRFFPRLFLMFKEVHISCAQQG